MDTKILYIFTRTPLHVGAGSSVGAIDMPVQRERHTGFPVIPGSSIKGVLRDACRRDEKSTGYEAAIFGTQESAGRVGIGEASILAFPVRSAKGAFAFITCPLALERLSRAGGMQKEIASVAEPADMSCISGDKLILETGNAKGVVLEEYRFDVSGPIDPVLEKALLGLLDDAVWQAGKGRFVILSDGDFAHFVRTACEVAQHVAIDPAKGTAKKGALFNLEAVPAETLFFATVSALSREEGELTAFSTMVASKPLVQFGGDSTTGLGFCTVKLV